MCDLIDLHSPNMKGLVELASPLIPAPKNNECTGETDLFPTEKRKSLHNNPFDTVLHETTEYICKKGDPFELTLEKALKKTTRLRAQAVDFADDFISKRKKHPKTLNKTLDESLIRDKLSLSIEKRDFAIKRSDKNGTLNKDSSEIICDNNVIENASISQKNQKTSCRDEDHCNLSILNYSVMNDALLEAVVKTEESQEVSTFPNKNMLSKERIHFENVSFKPLNTSYSLSQEVRSPERLRCLKQRSCSTSDISRKSSQATQSSLLERGFLESKQSEQSISSSLSNISSITKLNSASLTEFYYNDISTSLLQKRDSKDIINDKLIDVDIYMPRPNCNKEYSNSSVSSSSDSILTNNKISNGVSKFILNEANVLAGMFEELSLKADYPPAGMDDLISNNTLWMSELLPAYEDEVIVDNLIDLPASPEESTKDGEYKTNKKQSSTSGSIDNGRDNSLKELESQFIGCTSIEKQTIVTVLLDLKKLIQIENNPEANKLLDNLESVLDVKWKNNTELLTTCLQITNDLQTSEKVDNNLDIITKKSEQTSIDRNETEIAKVLSEENDHNSGSSLVQEIKDTLQITAINSNDSSIQNLSSISNNKHNSKYHLDMVHSEITSDCNNSKEKNNYSDEKLAMELLSNLGKLLSSQTEDVTILHLLKNIRKVLNFPSNNCEIPNQLQADNKIDHVQLVTSKKVAESPLLTKSVYKRNSDLKSELREKTSNNIPSLRISKNKELFQLKETKKRFSSDPGLISTLTNKKIQETTNLRTNMQSKTATVFDIKKEKSIPITEIKYKLKKRSDIVNKRGPIKAIHPVANMQGKGKQTNSLFQATISPKSNNVGFIGKNIGNIPNMMDNNYIPKKIIKSKPVASSTPDDKLRRIPGATLFCANDSKKCNSFDFSPITNGINEYNNSPKRFNKPPTPRKCTPKRQRNSSSIPKYYLTPPRVKKHNLSSNMNHQSLLESSKCLNKSFTDYQRCSTSFSKRSTEKIQQSPLKDKNNLTVKAKPSNLISKFKRHSMSDLTEKENYYN